MYKLPKTQLHNTKICYKRDKEKAYITNIITRTLTKTYSEHRQTSKMELSAKTANGLKQLFVFAKNSITDAYVGFLM